MDPFTVALPQLEELIARLTPRQMEIVELLARGHGNREIAAILSISCETVKFHIRRARNKMQVENRIQLIVIFAMWKVIENDVAPSG